MNNRLITIILAGGLLISDRLNVKAAGSTPIMIILAERLAELISNGASNCWAMIKHIIIIILLLLPFSIAYTASNSQLNITIYDSYNSYHKESNNLNITVQPNIQGYNSYTNLNITFAKIAFFQIGPGGASTSTSSTSTSTSSIATTSVPSSGGGGGGGSSGRDIIYIDRPPITETIREIIREPQIIYNEIVSTNPYRLSSVLLTIIMVILLSIRIGSFISQRRKAPYYQYAKMLKKEIKSKLKQGYSKEQILEAAKKAKWPEDFVRDTLDKF